MRLKDKIYNILYGIAEEDLTTAEKQILKLVKPKIPNCDDCRKCGETTCGNDTENLQCFEPK